MWKWVTVSFMVKMITHLGNQEAEVEKVSSMLIVSSY